MSDAAARRRALDPAQSFIVQAPAGSGKTSLLTQRFLRLLALVEAPEQIVAITFTRKAAAEMRRRILLALNGVEPADDASSENEQHTRELARAARRHADERGWALEQHPARLRIHTIDAFCRTLAAQSPVLARAGAELEVADDARELYAEAARRTLARVAEPDAMGSAVETLLRHRDNQFLATEQLIVVMLGKRDQWLPLVLGRRGDQLRERLERDLEREVLGHVRFTRALWPEENLQAVCALVAGAAERIDGESLAAWRGRPEMLQVAIEDFERWQSLARLLLKEDSEWRRALNVQHGFPPAARAAKETLLGLLAELAREPRLALEFAWLRDVPAPQLSDEHWRVTEALIEVLKLAAAELELVFRERGTVDFPAVLQAALHALSGAHAPTELALALDRRIRHLLVDEYQDTSSAQFALLNALTAEWSAGDGRTLFCVGDPMQSIYRFRQAEVGLFLRTRDQGLPGVALESLRLESNFRSQRRLIEWFNRVFAAVLPASDDVARGAVSHAPSAAVREPADPAVTIHPQFTPDPAPETDGVLEVIADVRRRMPDATIGILTRQRAHVAHIAARLRERDIRFQAVELETLASRPVVRDLLAITRALLHEGDRTAWLAILRSPVCGLSLSDLQTLVSGASLRTVRELLGDAEVVARLSGDGRRRAEFARGAIEAAIAQAGRASTRRRTEGLWLALGGPATTLSAAALEDAAAYLDHLGSLEARGALPAGQAFDAEFNDLFAESDPSAPAQLQIMTIHKAKGLEFDAVLLPGLGRGRQRHQSPLLHWLEVPQVEGPAGLLLAPIVRKGVTDDPHATYVAERVGECAQYESARLLYVAVTRARQELHLFGHVTARDAGGELQLRVPEAGSPLKLLWPAVRPEFDRVFAEHPTLAEPLPNTVPRAVLRRHRAAWRLPDIDASVGARGPAPPAVDPARPTFDWASEVSRHVGTVVHAEMDRWSRGALPGPDDINASRQRFERLLASLGVPVVERSTAAQRVIEALARTLADPRGRWLFTADHRAVRSELALSGPIDGVLVNAVIDRTFIDADGVRWIVDFKTSRHEGGALDAFLDNELVRYREQMTRYAALMTGLGTEPLRLGLYFPLLSGWREWSAQ